MAIDYRKARERIALAFTKGIIKTYGLRRLVPTERDFEQPGKLYWDKDQEWVDPKGKKRKGRFKRLPSVKIKHTVEIPQGVIPKEVLQYASAVADAFIEVLRIAEENGLATNAEGMSEVAARVGENLGKGA